MTIQNLISVCNESIDIEYYDIDTFDEININNFDLQEFFNLEIIDISIDNNTLFIGVKYEYSIL